MIQLPDNVNHYKSTPIFTEETIPEALKKNHNTKTGVWALIYVHEGELEYIIEDEEKHMLTPENPGIVEPQVQHHISPLGPVKLHVEFYR